MEQDLRDAWLAEDPLPDEPVAIVKRWLDEAFAEGRQESPHAVALATVDPDGRPSVRMLLVSEIDVPGARFVFYTNRESRKGRALAADPRAAIVFNWPGRQARVEGVVAPTCDATSDAYFATRPLEARLGAWASRQSEPVASRAALLETLAEVAERFDARAESDVVPRPPHWGGYALRAEQVELWASRRGRIHDRALWSRVAAAAGTTAERWDVTRLQP
jgi:pyridoxamine 5'-phosphate oxidase